MSEPDPALLEAVDRDPVVLGSRPWGWQTIVTADVLEADGALPVAVLLEQAELLLASHGGRRVADWHASRSPAWLVPVDEDGCITEDWTPFPQDRAPDGEFVRISTLAVLL